MSKCNKLNKAPFRPLVQAALKDTVLPQNACWKQMHCQFSRLEWSEGHPAQAVQCAPTESSLPLPRWPLPPWSQAHTHRPPRVRVHRRERPPGLRPHLGRPAGKDGPGRGSPNSGDRRSRHPGTLPPHALARTPGIPALTPVAPGPAGAPVSQLRRSPPVSRTSRLSGLGIRRRQNNGGSRGQRGDSGGGDGGGKGSGSGGGRSGGDGVCLG